jgi:hypothetical protein
MKNLTILMNTMSNQKREIALDNRFPYIYTKADLYLKIGSAKYRKQDFFNQPDISLNKDELLLIEVGCTQILEGKGIVKEDPFIGLGISGFRILFNLFHFDTISHKSKSVNIQGEKGILDEMHLEHSMHKQEITYYNWVR